MNVAREPELAELAIDDPPERWRALGFDVLLCPRALFYADPSPASAGDRRVA